MEPENRKVRIWFLLEKSLEQCFVDSSDDDNSHDFKGERGEIAVQIMNAQVFSENSEVHLKDSDENLESEWILNKPGLPSRK